MSKTENFKVGDKVTIVGIGIGFVVDINPLGCMIHCVRGNFAGKRGNGYQDIDLRAGWVRV